MLNIDGAQGEGGGQVLRTALALSAIQGLPVEVHSIRAGRRNPGLQAQHLTALTALGQVCGARIEGAHLGSQWVIFAPEALRSGEYRFEVGTAGSTSLVLQAILLPLAVASGSSRVTLTGGTHVPWSPPADYVRDVLLPVLAGMGVAARLELRRWGFYPKGGGQVVVEVDGGAKLCPTNLIFQEGAIRIRGVSAVANLPRRIAERQRDRALRRLTAEGLSADIEVTEADAPGAGTSLMLVAEGGGVPAGFSALGEHGKPSEQVADEAVNALLEYLKARAACDPHLADQLVLPMALAPGTSRLTTSRVTKHLLTTVQVTQQVLGCPMQISGEEGSPGAVTIQGVGSSAENRVPPGWPRAETRSSPFEIRNLRPEPRSRDSKSEIGLSSTSDIRHPTSEIRKARAEDVPAIQRLVAYYAARGDLLPRTLNELYQHLRDFFVCEVDGQVVGICALSLYWEDLAEVRSLAVHEEHGGKGLGAALVNACLGEAAQLGVRRVFALTYRPGFFERLGFLVIDKGELPQKIWKDCIKCAKFACCDEVALIRDT